MIYEIFDLLSIVMTTISTTILILTSRKSKTLKYFILCQCLLIIWTLCHLLEFNCKNVLQQLILNDIGYFSVCTIGATFLIFTFHYTELKIKNITIILIYLLSFIMYFLMVTNPFLGLYFKKYEYRIQVGGFGFYATIVITYLYVFSGMILLLYKNIKSYKTRKKQIYLIVFASFIPIIINFLYQVLNIKNKYDLTPGSFCLTSVFIIIAIYKYDFMDINQLGLRQSVDRLSNHTIIFNNKNILTYINNSFCEKFGKNIYPETTDINKFYDVLQKYINEKQKTELKNFIFSSDKCKREFCFFINNKKVIYIIEKYSLFDLKSSQIGYTISMTDITQYFNMLKELEIKNDKLNRANERLIEMNLISQQLAVEKERHKIAQDLHDTLGHSLVSVMTLIKLEIMSKKYNDTTSLEKILNILENILNDVRISVSGLYENSKLGLICRLNDLISNMGNIKNKIEITVIGDENDKHYFATETLFLSIREAITNSLKYSKAEKIDVIIKFKDDMINVFVIDNGNGCGKIEKGIGLKGIEERVYKIGGKAEFFSDVNEGFRMNIEIPIREQV